MSTSIEITRLSALEASKILTKTQQIIILEIQLSQQPLVVTALYNSPTFSTTPTTPQDPDFYHTFHLKSQ